MHLIMRVITWPFLNRIAGTKRMAWLEIPWRRYRFPDFFGWRRNRLRHRHRPFETGIWVVQPIHDSDSEPNVSS
jgi:hypothetical protein